MKYQVITQADAAPFWEALSNAPTGADNPRPLYVSFANYAEVVLYSYNVLQTWAQDQAYTVPTAICTTAITHVVYFIPPLGGKTGDNRRVFVGFVHDGGKKMLVCEVTLLQVLIGFSTVRSAAGVPYTVTNSGIVYKGEVGALQIKLNWDPSKYLNAEEVKNDQGVHHLHFDVGVPWLGEGTFNQAATVLSALWNPNEAGL